MNNQQKKTILSSSDKISLKKLAHHLKPVIQIGKKGVTSSLIDEINKALSDHDLIKVQFLGEQKNDIARLVLILCEKCGCDHVDTIGNIAILYKEPEEESMIED